MSTPPKMFDRGVLNSKFRNDIVAFVHEVRPESVEMILRLLGHSEHLNHPDHHDSLSRLTLMFLGWVAAKRTADLAHRTPDANQKMIHNADQ